MRPYSQIPQLPATTLRTGEESGTEPTTAHAGEETSTFNLADSSGPFGEF